MFAPRYCDIIAEIAERIDHRDQVESLRLAAQIVGQLGLDQVVVKARSFCQLEHARGQVYAYQFPSIFPKSWSGQPRSAARVQDSERTIRRLEELRRFRRDIFVSRAEPDETLRAFMEGDCRIMMVDGPSGSGRSSWVANAASRRLESRSAILFAGAQRCRPD